MRFGGVVATVVGLCAAFGVAQANDQAANPDNYPNWRGQWYRTKGVQWDTAKPPGRGQQAPLTPEYQARYEVSLAEQQRGGQEYKPQVKCMRAGMPQMMVGYEPIEIIVTPQSTYMWMVYMHEFRRIFYGWAELPGQDRAELCGLLDREMARYQRRRQIRHAGSRDPRLQGAADL
jgi:hypothetical protein